MDVIDIEILQHLTRDGRMTWAELAGEIGLSPPSAADRVKKLEAAGTIRGYAAILDPVAVGSALLAFVAVQVSSSAAQEALERWAKSSAEVQECHVVAGGDDYLLKVRCRDAAHLERLLREELRAVEGVVRTRSTIVPREFKESPRVPIDSPSPS